jgi:hypothetical protein
LRRLFDLDLPASMLLQALAIGAAAAIGVGPACRLAHDWGEGRRRTDRLGG